MWLVGVRILVRRGLPSPYTLKAAIKGTIMAVTGSLLGHWYTRPHKQPAVAAAAIHRLKDCFLGMMRLTGC